MGSEISAGPAHVFVYDNSPDSDTLVASTSLGDVVVHHKHDPTNGGVVAAYNWAWKESQRLGCKWLLLLDQDATLPRDYLVMFWEQAATWSEAVAAATPKVRAGNRRLSPQRVCLGLTLPWPIHSSAVGPHEREVVGLNSGTFVKVSFIADVGGWNAHYKLDAADFWLFAEIYARGRIVAILPCEIDHALSVARLSDVSRERFESVVRAEALFYGHMRSRLTRVAASQMMLLRACKHLMQGHRTFAKIGAGQAVRLLKRVIYSQDHSGGS